jgi:uncharacterized repeat protein (TIGR01451 family)
MRGSGQFGRRTRRKAGRTRCRLECEVIERRLLLATYTVTSTNDTLTAGGTPAPNTLRWAIEQVDADTALDEIQFNIAGRGVQKIAVLGTPLPAITTPVVIDGTMDSGGAPLIQIDGSNLAGSPNGLVVSAGGSTISGLAIVGFKGAGLVLNSVGGNVVAADYLGVEASGSQAEANGVGLSIAGSSSNTIGGAAGSRNVISGNSGDGILIAMGSGPASSNEILGNLIGTSPAGSSAMANGGSGIAIVGASGTEIGFAALGSCNVISGNSGTGIAVSSGATGTLIQNNEIGVTADGKSKLGNGGDGILLDDAPQTLIGGSDPHEGNEIGANADNGINTSGDTIGLLVAGNFIGTDTTATINLGNDGNGVNLGSSQNTIGGTLAGAGNTIYYNGVGKVASGVQLVGSVAENEILSNSIYDNDGLGINLGNGPTPNNPPGTPGPNDFQNYPNLSIAESDGSTTTIAGTLSSTPSTQFLIQFFSSPTGDFSGFGQGKVLLGSQSVQTDAHDNASFTLTFATATVVGHDISATATDPRGDTSEFARDVAVQGETNLQLSATGTPNPVVEGHNLTYTLSVTNPGTVPAQGVVLTDQLPATITLVSAFATQGAIDPSARGTVTASLSTIRPGGKATVTIVVTTSANSPGTISDLVNVTCQQVGPTADSATATVTTIVDSEADLSVALSASANTILAGADLTYTMELANGGPDAADNVTATLPLAAGVTFISATTTAGTVSYAGGKVVAALSEMAAGGQPTTVKVVVQPETAGELNSTATITALDNQDPNSLDDSSSASTTVEPASDLTIGITTSPRTVVSNDPFDYVVTVNNAGPSDDSQVVISDTLPAGVTYQSASADQGVTPIVKSGVVSATFATLSSGASVSLTIVVVPTVAPGSKLSDTASVTGQNAEPAKAINTATLATLVVGRSDRGIAVASAPASAYVGQNITYTLDISNLGPDAEPDAVLSFPCPADLVLVSASSIAGEPAPVIKAGMFTAQLGSIAVSSIFEYSVTISPQAAAAGTLVTTFSVGGQNVDSDSANDNAQASVAVTPAADLAVTVTPGAATPAHDADWSYTLTVTDLGLSPATGVTALAPLPANAQFEGATSSQGTAPIEAGGAVSAALGNIAPGQSATVTIVVQPDAVGPLLLNASAGGDQHDPNTANNHQSLVVSVAPSADLTVSLHSEYPTVLTGEPWTFGVTVANSGPDSATSVALDMPLASQLVVDSSQPAQMTTSFEDGQLVAQVGTIAPGSSATFYLVVTATTAGSLYQSAFVTEAENQLDPRSTAATTAVTVLESAGILQFGSTTNAVAETAGLAQLQVIRIDGALGAITVNYQTVAQNATPGLDFVPTSGTLSFASGQTAATIAIPVLADPWDNQDEYLSVVLSAPTGGAGLGTFSRAQLKIVDVDPDYTPPEVSNLSWTGTSRSITSLTVSFTAPLNQAYAMNSANYVLVAPSMHNLVIPLTAKSYSAAGFSVTLAPSISLPSGQFYQLRLLGTGATAIRDIAGNLLDGAGNGLPASNYVASFAQGTRLQYRDAAGNNVTLKLARSGYMEQVRNAAGEGILLELVGIDPHHATLSGSVHRVVSGRARFSRSTSGTTNLGTLEGFGNFGDVKVLLTSPPFYSNQVPFQRKGRGVL